MPELARQMELPQQIETWREFFEVNKIYHDKLHEQARLGKHWITVGFSDLALHNPELANLLLDDPEETLKAGQVAIERMDLPHSGDLGAQPVEIRLIDLPSEQELAIRVVRSQHLNKFVQIKGIVRQKSDVRPQVTSARFECPTCGNIIPVLQIDVKFKEPPRCGCGRKGKFKLLSKELVDAQSLTLEEAPEDLDGGDQPKRLKVFLKKDLVSPMTDKRTNPGSKVQIAGVIKEVPIVLQTGGQSTRYDLMMDVNSVVTMQEDFTEIEISAEEKKEILELSQDPDLFEKLVASIVPSIYGYEPIKQALLLQLFGGVHKLRGAGGKNRGDIHVLLIGDPGAGKSVLLKRIAGIAPKARFVAGKGASGAGLCVAPGSTLLTNPGGMETIERVVEQRLISPSQVRPDVWKQEHITDVKIQSMSHDLKLHARHPDAIWKLKSPKRVFVVTLASGKKVELTGNTQLLTLESGKTRWRRSSEIAEGMHVATPRTLIGGRVERQPIVDLIVSDPVVHSAKPFVKEIVKILSEKHGSIRSAAKALGENENSLYWNWVDERARGNIKLQTLKKLADEAGVQWKEKVRTVSLYNGKTHALPMYLDEDFLYVAGLIAGDGDVRKSGSTCSIRLSNSNPAIHQSFRQVLSKQFGLPYDVQARSGKRAESTRTHSVLLGQILSALGIPFSPKSHRISMSNTLLYLSSDLLAAYLAGLYDADGSVHIRKSRGSDCIALTTCSQTLARQVQLVLLRYAIRATIRSRSPTKGEIEGKHLRWVVEIRGGEICKFKKCIPLRHPLKVAALRSHRARDANTNVDIIPTAGRAIKKLLQSHGISLKKAGWHENLSRKALQRLVGLLPESPEVFPLRQLAHSDIFWEMVKNIEEKEAPYEFVYDLTVEDSHNFVVDGVLVHNTAAVVKDDFIRGWALEAGALVLANKGIVCIDELDKMTAEDTSAMHEALEQQTISISKANIQATLRCETTVLAAANPKFGRFDPFEIISKQINLPPALISRFDLIFPIRDLPDKDKDEKLASFILTMHKEHDVREGMIEPEKMRKYIAYARQKCRPQLTETAVQEIKEYYVRMRGGDEQQDDRAVKPIPITARQLEALVRLSEASARVRLSEKVTKRDAQVAIELVHYCLQKIGMDPETGKFDLDRVTTGITASQRSHITIVKDIIQELERKVGKTIPIDDVVREAGIKGVADDTAHDVIERLKRAGDIYSPKHGFISRL